MSRANASTAKPATSSSKITKAVPTAWKDRLTAQDYEELVNWLVERCRSQPELSFLDAVTALIAALEQRPQ